MDSRSLLQTSQVSKGPKAECVIFLHIPKTAGSTLNWILQNLYSSTELYKLHWYFHNAKLPLDEFRTLPEDQKERIKLIAGHMKFGIHTVVTKPHTYITVLREPASRVVSGYYNILRDKNHPLHQAVYGKSLEEYVVSGVAADVDNGQTRRISGAGMDTPYGECGPEMLEQAKQNIDGHFSTVGLTERFDETLVLLQKELAWPMPYYLTQNRGRNKPTQRTLSAKAEEEIRRYNQLDQELYQYASDRFEMQILNYGKNFEKDLQRFQALNRYWFRIQILPHRVQAKVRWEMKKLLKHLKNGA